MPFPGQRLERLTDDAARAGVERTLDKMDETIGKLIDVAPTDAVMLPSGGDFCRPSRLNASIVEEWNARAPDRPARLATASEYFAAVAEQADRLPVVHEDFNPLFQGTYTTRIDIKHSVRWGEHALLASEIMQVVADAVDPQCEPAAGRHERAVEILLYNQFHDTICGTIIIAAYQQDVRPKCREMERLFDEEMTEHHDRIVAAAACPGAATHVAVFNPLPYPRKEVVEAKVSFHQEGVKGVELADEQGRLLPVHVEVREEWRGDTLDLTQATLRFTADLPPGGQRFFRAIPTQQAQPAPAWRPAEQGCHWKDDTFAVDVGRNGCITRLTLKPQGIELVSPERPCLNDVKFQLDQGDAWALYEAPINPGAGLVTPVLAPYIDQRDDRSRMAAYASKTPAQLSVLETDAVTIVKCEQTVNLWAKQWPLTRYIFLYPGLGRIDFRTEFEPEGRHYRLIACFPTAIERGRVQQEIPFGFESRGEGEYPVQNWMAYEDDEKGLLLLNRGQPGNNVTDGVMMLSLFRAVDLGPYHYPSRDMFYEGERQRFEYSLVPFAGRGQRGEVGAQALTPARWGFAYNVPPRARAHAVDPAEPQSWFSLTPGNICLTSLRPVEAGTLVRLYETQGRSSQFALELALPLSEAVETDCLGRPLGRRAKPIRDRTLRGRISPFEIKTFVMS